SELGFFDLFDNKPKKPKLINVKEPDVNYVNYLKGKCGDSEKTRTLKEALLKLVDTKQIKKWTFLHSGLTEAITNVSHHAYPDSGHYKSCDKNWYLTGSFNKSTRRMKIVFYDQGIGIPKSLPASEIFEKVLSYISKLPLKGSDRWQDEVLLRAAVEMDRTSTYDTDRGKGLQDFQVFIDQLGSGSLSIISQKGLYKYTVKNDVSTIKTVNFKRPVYGTLIIWSVVL
ncbi:hypothetical protein ASV53_24155, partial [Photobacterium sanguinicancri]